MSLQKEAINNQANKQAANNSAANNIPANQKLVFLTPASVWEEEIPLGNGKMGAMVSGGVLTERVRLNQDSVWSCGPKNRLNPNALETLPLVRKAIFEGRLQEAEQQIYTGMLCDPNQMGHYEPLADLLITYEKRIPHYSELFAPQPVTYSSYTRTLRMDLAEYDCSYEKDDVRFERQMFMSYPDQVLVMKLTSSEQKGARLNLARNGGFSSVFAGIHEEGFGILGLSGGGADHAPEYQILSYVFTDGTIRSVGNYLDICDASEILVLLTSTTTYYEDNPMKWCQAVLEKARGMCHDDLLRRHQEDYSELYNRVELSVGDEDIERYFNFSRYLMIAGSRPGSLPLNLQGVWNKDMNPSWGSRYTININLQMNYWPALLWNLPECQQPLLDFIVKMLPQAQKTAKEMYGCRGAVAHHNTDIYGDCAPNETWMPASIWPMGYAWLCCHIIDQYHFFPSPEFARKYLKPVREASVFFLDYLTMSPEGRLVTVPSTSPENTYILPNGEKSAVCYGPVMDTQIIKELWKGYLLLSEAAGHPEPAIEIEIRTKMELLPDYQIGSQGQLLEWQTEYEEWEKGHRHISHLFGLYPGTELDPSDPEIHESCKKTIAGRLQYGGGQTGWSSAWLINFYARLGDGEAALAMLNKLLKEQTAPNLFDLHPPLSPGMDCVFQIDGNFGAAAGIMEMIYQSMNRKSSRLPALPASWKTGYLKGIRSRGGEVVDVVW